MSAYSPPDAGLPPLRQGAEAESTGAKRSQRYNAMVAIAIVVILIVVWLCVCTLRRLARKYDHFAIEQTVGLRSSVDGQLYRVHGVHSTPDAAANKLAEINRRATELLRRLRKEYASRPGGVEGVSEARRDVAQKLLRKYSPDALAENSPLDPEKETSFTENKGSLVAICLRTSVETAGGGVDYRLQDINTLMFVTIHEMAHIGIVEIDHPPNFWRTFRFLLEEAVACGIYAPVDYSVHTVRYCNRLVINHSPLFDPTIVALA
jgi:hypothetical protein